MCHSYTPIQRHILQLLFFIHIFRWFLFLWRQFSPILILLFNYSRKDKGVQKFLLEKLSYIFVYDLWYSWGLDQDSKNITYKYSTVMTNCQFFEICNFSKFGNPQKWVKKNYQVVSYKTYFILYFISCCSKKDEQIK